MALARCSLLLCIFLWMEWACPGPASALAQSEAQHDPPAVQTVVAYVNQQPVYLSELDYLIRITYRRTKIPPAALRRLRTQALETTLRRLLVLEHLRRQGKAVSPEELESHLRQFRRRLEANRLSLQQHLRQIGLSQEQFRRAVDWKLSWARFLARELTPEKLQDYYRRHRRQFDGTQLRVAHLLLKAPAEDRQARKRLIQLARQLRQQIVSGRMSFQQAVEQYSQGTKQNGGELGWIGRRGDMPEPFARAAFALAPGEISQPVETPAGVHLIRVLEQRPGRKKLEEVQAQVRQAAARDLFLQLSTPLLEQAQIRITGVVPWRPAQAGP